MVAVPLSAVGLGSFLIRSCHVEIKYLPQMPDEPHRHYLFVAIGCVPW